MSAEFAESVQRAAAFVAARSRGDRDAAEAMLAEFDDDGQRLFAFCVLAELAIRLLADRDGDSVDAVASRLAVTIAGVGDDPGAVARPR